MIAVPVGLTVGMVCGSPARVSSRILPLVLIVALSGALVTFAAMGWVVPASNQAYRFTVIQRDALRGPPELTFVELHSLMGATESAISALAPQSDRWNIAVNYYARFAVSCTPLAFALLGVCAATLARMTRRVLVIATACAYVAYLLITPDWFRAFPPLLVAWLPTASIAAIGTFLRSWASIRQGE